MLKFDASRPVLCRPFLRALAYPTIVRKAINRIGEGGVLEVLR